MSSVICLESLDTPSEMSILEKQVIEAKERRKKLVFQFTLALLDKRNSQWTRNGIYIPDNQFQLAHGVTEYYKSGEQIDFGICSSPDGLEIFKQVQGQKREYETLRAEEFDILLALTIASEIMLERTYGGGKAEVCFDADCTIDEDNTSSKEWINSLKDKIEP